MHTGCEFFKNYKSNNYNGRGLQFDWEQVRQLTALQEDARKWGDGESEGFCLAGGEAGGGRGESDGF